MSAVVGVDHARAGRQAFFDRQPGARGDASVGSGGDGDGQVSGDEGAGVRGEGCGLGAVLKSVLLVFMLVMCAALWMVSDIALSCVG